jgi:hypothetical protein
MYDTISTTIMRMPLEELGSYGLTKFRLLSDIGALRQNTLPKRKERIKTNLDMLFRNFENRYSPTQLFQKPVIERVWDDKYDELEL